MRAPEVITELTVLIYIYCDIRRLANIDNATFTMHQSYPEQLLGRIAKKAFGQLGCKGG